MSTTNPAHPGSTRVHIGFVGPRDGMTAPQLDAVFEVVRRHALAVDVVVHHGDRAGGDAQLNQRCLALDGARVEIVIHPGPLGDPLREMCAGGEILDPLPDLERDRAIVRASDVLVAAPRFVDPQSDDEAWRVVDLARDALRELYIIGHDGRRLDREGDRR